jgi:hypothetical protein
MSVNSLLHEIEQLRKVSANIEALAAHHPLAETALLSISGNIRSSAVLLEVLLATRVTNRSQ